MQSWQYQYNVDFQYTYGVAALIIVSAIMVIAGLKGRMKHVVVLTSLCICAVMMLTLTAPKTVSVLSYMHDTSANREQADELIDEVPADATVTASHSLVPHLYRVEWLYTMPDYYTDNRDKPIDTDYFVIDTRFPDLADEMKSVMGDNYTLIRSAAFVELYRHN